MRENQMPSAAVGRRLGMMGDVVGQQNAARVAQEGMMNAVPGPPVAKPMEDMLTRFNYLLNKIRSDTAVLSAVADRVVGPVVMEAPPEDGMQGGPLLMQLHHLLGSMEAAASRLESEVSRLNSVV